MSKKDKKDKTPFPLKAMSWIFPRLEKYLPWLSKKLFVHVFFTPARYPFPEKEKYYLYSAEKTSLKFEGRNVQVYKWGEGKPVLLVHGWMGRATQFRKFIPAFNDAGYAIVAFDAPAHGKSEGVKSHLMYFVRVIEILSRDFSFEGIIGHSLGGVAGLHAIHRGISIPKHIMIGSPSIADEIIGEFLRRLNVTWKTGSYFKDYIKKTYGIPFEHYSAVYIASNLKKGQPMLLIYDEDDIEVKVEHGIALKKIILMQNYFLQKDWGIRVS